MLSPATDLSNDSKTIDQVARLNQLLKSRRYYRVIFLRVGLLVGEMKTRRGNDVQGGLRASGSGTPRVSRIRRATFATHNQPGSVASPAIRSLQFGSGRQAGRRAY